MKLIARLYLWFISFRTEPNVPIEPCKIARSVEPEKLSYNEWAEYIHKTIRAR